MSTELVRAKAIGAIHRRTFEATFAKLQAAEAARDAAEGALRVMLHTDNAPETGEGMRERIKARQHAREVLAAADKREAGG